MGHLTGGASEQATYSSARSFDDAARIWDVSERFAQVTFTHVDVATTAR